MEKDNTEITAPFNMAVATLMRIDKILQQITNLTIVPLDSASKQIMKIGLVKQFYLNSVPLLSKEAVTKFEWILNLKENSLQIIDNHQKRLTDKFKVVYSTELELKMDKALSDIQVELQKEGRYMMPSKKDPRYNWNQE